MLTRASKSGALTAVTCLAGAWCDEAALTSSAVPAWGGRVLWMSGCSLRGRWVSTGAPAPSTHNMVASLSRDQQSSKLPEPWTWRNSPLRSRKKLRCQPVLPLTQCRGPRRPLTAHSAGTGRQLLASCRVPSKLESVLPMSCGVLHQHPVGLALLLEPYLLSVAA